MGSPTVTNVPLLGWDVDSGGGSECMGAEGKWELSILSASKLCCEPRAAL